LALGSAGLLSGCGGDTSSPVVEGGNPNDPSKFQGGMDSMSTYKDMHLKTKTGKQK
jgi:hypothetical protein